MRANEIVEYLQQFMDSNYKKVLINGEWGIGKTKYISDFINDYSNTCYVSLFGKKDVDTVIQEIYFQILDRAPKGKFKKSFSLVRQKMNSLDISISGVSLSVPVIQNMLKALSKELTQRETFIIVFDDLERRHDALDIKEIFGLIDSLSKIENIKIVIVAATNHISNDHKGDFDNFKEKAIDREYTIDEYAKDAPKAILGDEVWKVVENISRNLKFRNLRTFEKIRNFIDEVTQILGEEQFTDKFTRADLYRMCFAIVFFRVEHKGEMVLLDSNPKNELFNTMYSIDNGDILYLSHHILKDSLENDMCRGVFPHIKNWFETGSYSKEDITSLITNINNHQEEPHNFYSSESQVEVMIDNTRSYIRNLKGNEKITDIIANLTSALSWCEVLSVNFGISENEIIELIQPNILFGVNGNISRVKT
ncbi:MULTISPECIES: P-loop NTPase fold protein [Paenibacillus]|uniref:P-loop NTPase fold protein n=2 Tax=Paenibacillus TaxID=44249 RepID=A0ABT8JFQ5_9BACL|nr:MULTISPECIES: P-loop NTPase fold protein [Paenibacillus]KGP82028.1 hypothetical protein P364_0114550 [Paenibacillus sp. MAEPY2]MDN4603950.1 P-loop NTPase fold protein [Paenibacillus vandeheii]